MSDLRPDTLEMALWKLEQSTQPALAPLYGFSPIEAKLLLAAARTPPADVESVVAKRDKYLCGLLVDWSIRANDGEDHGVPAEHILRTLIKISDERRAPEPAAADGENLSDLTYREEIELECQQAMEFGDYRAAVMAIYGITQRPRQPPEPPAQHPAVAVLEEVMLWIDNWDPPFIYDPEWPATHEKARAALTKPGSQA